MPSSFRSKGIRWAAPVVVAAVIGLVALVPTLSAGADPPNLAPLTAQELLVKVHDTNVQALSGTIQLTTNLGLPDLGALSGAVGASDNGFNPVNLLAGTHQAQIWIDGADLQRIAEPATLAENDVIHNGQDIWTWQSSNQKVTHYHLAPHSPSASPATKTPEPPAGSVETPAQAAQKLIDQITPSTNVTVTVPDWVAGQPVYRLVLSPKDAASTVDRAEISIDANTWLPLQVSVFAKGQSKVAVQLGFNSIDYSKPAASTFAFSPPPGSTVTTKEIGAKGAATGTPEAADPAKPATPDQPSTTTAKTGTVNQDWTTVLVTTMPTTTNGRSARETNDLLKAATPVSGKWGSGRLMTTSLVNVLFLDDGRVAVGAVTPDALEAAVGSLG
jgi:outer membrane lipoprotein-sorting protein